MRTRPLVWCLVLIIAVAVLGVGATIITGKTPLLGLDLQGGVSVVEKPQGHVTASDLQESQQIINNRVNGLGVSNSNVTIQGNNIVIELPGAKNDTAVLKVVGQTAQLFFRPVDCIIPQYLAPASSTTTTTAPKNGTTTTTVNPKTTTPAATKTTKAAAASGGLVDLGGIHLASADFPLAAGTTTVPTTAGSTTTTTAPSKPITSTAVGTQICGMTSAQQETYLPAHGTSHGVTPAEWDLAGSTVVLPLVGTGGGPAFADGRYVLGPAEMSGSIIKSASANLNSQTDQWEVDLTFTSRGSTEFNKYAAAHYACYQEDPSNPPYCALQAIELDAVVQSAPAIEAASFPGGATISGSSSNPFTQQQAQNLALALSYGSLPVRFVPQDISSVSPQIGTDSLRAGAVAGALAVLLVLLYLIIYYRALGLVVVVSICVSGALLYAITTLLSADRGPCLDPFRGDRPNCVRWRDGGLLRRVLRASERRDPRWAHRADLGRKGVHTRLPDRPGSGLLVVHSRFHPLRADGGRRPGVCLLPRPGYAAQRCHDVPLHPSARHPHRPSGLGVEGGFLGVNRGLGVSPLTT